MREWEEGDGIGLTQQKASNVSGLYWGERLSYSVCILNNQLVEINGSYR